MRVLFASRYLASHLRELGKEIHHMRWAEFTPRGQVRLRSQWANVYTSLEINEKTVHKIYPIKDFDWSGLLKELENRADQPLLFDFEKMTVTWQL